MPDYDKFEVSLPEDSIVSILVQYKQKANNLMVKLYDANSASEVGYDPIVKTKTEASGAI